ncbi:hypothetical protein D3C86_1457390 [compost metagenome]
MPGIEEAEGSEEVLPKDWDVNLYPNPASGTTRLEFNNMQANKVTIEVIDIAGKIINSEIQTLSDSLIEVNLSYFDKGTYFVKVSSANGTKTKRLVVR